jgi:hypothetical protein
MFASAAALALGMTSLHVPAVSAANSPTFRDCSLFVSGFDEDFVEISGVTLTPQGTLTVQPSQNSVQLEASESSDPGDSAGHVTLAVTVNAPGVHSRTVTGAAVGRVFVAVPLAGSGTGRTYTISWAATFDNGNHLCPSPQTPENTTPSPFVVTVS